MNLVDFVRDYEALGPGEQATFAETIKRLLSDGLIWRDDEGSRAGYRFLQMRGELVSAYLAPGGWRIEHHEPAHIYFLRRDDGAHRRHLGRDLTIWLLIARLLYAEARERPQASLTPNPAVRVGDFFDRYASYLPGQTIRKKTSLAEGLRALQGLKLIRPGGAGGWNPADPEAVVELLPTLEVVVSAGDVAQLAERLAAFGGVDGDASAGDGASGGADAA